MENGTIQYATMGEAPNKFLLHHFVEYQCVHAQTCTTLVK